jgi:DNA-binding PadR family transcriptional regulator
MTTDAGVRREPYMRREPPRSHRRLLLTLLTGATNLGGFTVCQAAQINSGTFYPVIARLGRTFAWVDTAEEVLPPDADPGRPPRRFYRLTCKGQQHAAAALGLHDISPLPGLYQLPAASPELAASDYTMRRADKRILLALLPGASNATFSLLRWLTGTGPWRFTAAMGRLEDHHWITRDRDEGLPCYRLTGDGYRKTVRLFRFAGLGEDL